MKKLIRMMATCRNFRQVVAVRFFRTTTNLFQFVTQCVTNSVIRNSRTTELQFAGMKISIADHFRDLTKLIIIVKGGKREVEDYSELPIHVKTMDGFYAPFYKMECRIASY